MLKRSQFRILTALAAIGLLLALVNMVLFSQNRVKQAEVAQRAQYIQQTVQLEPLYRELVKALGELTVRNNDTQLRDLLAKQGITVNLPPAQSSAPPPAPEPKKGK